MPSLKHLGHLTRETYRIAVSEPFTPARQARRICLLWGRALGGVNKILLVMTVAFAVLVVLRATGADHLRGLSPVDWAIIGLGVLLVIAVLCRSRPVRILPFKNLADGAGNQQAAAVAAGFAELLDDEVRRIVDLVRQEPFRTPADVLNPAGRRGDMVRRSSARVAFKTGMTATGLPGDIKPTEVGTITLGPLKLEVGTVLACLERIFGTTLQGSLVEADGVLRVVASQSGLRGGRTWSAQIRVDGDTRSPDGRLARELAHRIELDRPWASESGADVESFQRLGDGLESYQRFQQEGALQDLDEAEDHFRAALAHSPEYAAAYHNLGLVYREQQRVRTELRLTVSEAVGDGSIRMWQKAVDLDPTLAPARVQLARAFLDKASPPGVADDKRADLLQQAVQSARSALEQPSGAHSMESTLARYWLGYALRKQGGQQHPDGTRRSDDMTWEALASFRRTEQDLIDERARRLMRDGTTTSVRPLAERIAQVIGQQAKCWAQLADEAVGSDRRRYVGKAKSRVGTAIGWAPGLPELHALRGSILLRYDPGDGAWHAFMEALQRDPQNHHITPGDLDVFTAMTSGSSEDCALAADLFVLAAHRRPDDAMAWLLLALLASEDRHARSLAGKGLALDPGSDEVRRMVDAQWPANGTADGTKQFTLVWAQAWDAARRAQRSGNATRLREALGDIGRLCVQHGRTHPEVTYVSREIGLLHTSLALMTDPSGDQRAQFRLAIRHLTRAVALKPPPGVEVPPLWYVELADAHAALADSLSGRRRGHKAAARDKVAAAKNYEEAIRNYNEAINKSPKTVRPRYHTGRGGRERFTELTAEPPDLSPRARAAAGRAAVYASQGRVNDAIHDCRDALKLAPLYAYPRFTLAVLYREQRAQYDLARQTLLRLIELLPAGEERDRGRLELARTYRIHAEASPADDSERLLDLALEGLGKATREASLSKDLEAEIYEELATVLSLLGRSREAITALRSITDALDRTHRVQHHERIARLMARGEQPLEVERELIMAQRACRDRLRQARGTDEEQVLDAALVSLKAQLAMFYAEQGIKLRKAHRMARNALRTAPSSLDPVSRALCEDARGWVAYREGRVRKAVRSLEDAVEHSAGDAREWAHLALALEARSTSLLGHKEKHLDRARDIWQQILEQCPRSPAAEQARQHLNLLPDHLHRPRPLASRGLGAG
ncbi:hypothetical protein [Streptomyces sp. NPDC047869]|uniref:tetratricopeptide repeat protein n=1 Tax=Streptomyces sp. NPDC047869 TaxID=3154709 RepID=UPI00345545D9